MGKSDGQELALMCKLMLGARLVWYIRQIHAGLLHLGIASAVFGDLKSRPPLSPSIRISLVSFFLRTLGLSFQAVELESMLTNHVDMTRKTRQTPFTDDGYKGNTFIYLLSAL